MTAVQTCPILCTSPDHGHHTRHQGERGVVHHSAGIVGQSANREVWWELREILTAHAPGELGPFARRVRFAANSSLEETA